MCVVESRIAFQRCDNATNNQTLSFIRQILPEIWNCTWHIFFFSLQANFVKTARCAADSVHDFTKWGCRCLVGNMVAFAVCVADVSPLGRDDTLTLTLFFFKKKISATLMRTLFPERNKYHCDNFFVIFTIYEIVSLDGFALGVWQCHSEGSRLYFLCSIDNNPGLPVDVQGRLIYFWANTRLSKVPMSPGMGSRPCVASAD